MIAQNYSLLGKISSSRPSIKLEKLIWKSSNKNNTYIIISLVTESLICQTDDK